MPHYISSDTTFGVEVEFQGVAKQALDDIKCLNYSIHDDGSTRGPVYTLQNGLAVIPQTTPNGGFIISSGMQEERAIGLELVTKPTPYCVLRNGLQELEERFVVVPSTPLTSVHIHVDVANTPWTYIQNTLLWAYHLEALLYRLSCLGTTHRGEKKIIYRTRKERNDYRYARPISQPIGCYWSNVSGSLIDINKLFSATTASQFLSAWGRADLFWSGAQQAAHYIGHRLHMINLLSVLRYGTLEWRLFDANYSHLTNFLDLVMAVHKLGEKSPPDFAPMVLGSKQNITCDEASYLLNLDITSLWGSRWPEGCKTINKAPHYGDVFVQNDEDMPVEIYEGEKGNKEDVLYNRRLVNNL